MTTTLEVLAADWGGEMGGFVGLMLAFFQIIEDTGKQKKQKNEVLVVVQKNRATAAAKHDRECEGEKKSV